MKNKRNCGISMPMYPGFMPNMMPGVPNMYPMGDMYYYNSYGNSNGSMDQLSSLNSQISSLERRVSNLESLIGNSNATYNTTNYQML